MKNYTISDKKIYTTTNYDLFVFTDWNRDISNARVVMMVESIQKVGWLPQPILVNEKFEVIDGQSRVKALECLEKPVEFIIMPGIGRAECQMLNLFQKNWTTMNYINSYVSDGNGNYIWLKDMLIRYKALTANVVMSIARSKGAGWGVGTKGAIDVISGGRLSLTEKERASAEKALFYLSRFAETANYMGGRKDTFYSAVMFMYLLDDVDNERLWSVVNNARYDGIVASSTVEGWLQQMEVLYNKNLRKGNKIDAVHEYKIA